MCNSNVVPYLHIDTDTLRTNYRHTHTHTRRFSSINESPGPSRNTKTHSLPRYFYIHPINLNNPLSLSKREEPQGTKVCGVQIYRQTGEGVDGNEKVECFNHHPAFENPGPTDGDANLNRALFRYIRHSIGVCVLYINRKPTQFLETTRAL